MDKRGQIYILGAIVLCIGIFSVMKVTNQFVGPKADNFDFYVENFDGEKSYVMNLGILREEEETYYLTKTEDSLLDIFQDFGVSTGIVLVEYNNQWKITNYLGRDNIVTSGCEDCEEFAIPSGTTGAADISFSFIQGGKKWKPAEDTIADISGDKAYFIHTIDGSKSPIVLEINENQYSFERPSTNMVEALLFRNVGKDYLRVVKV